MRWGTTSCVPAPFGLLALLLALTLAGTAGCDEFAEDKELIRENWARIVEANAGKDGETAASLFTAQSLARYPRLIALALDGKKAELEALDAWDLAEVLLMRLMSTRKQLQGLDGRAYVEYATSSGWYIWSEPDTSEPGKIRIKGDRAYVHFQIDGEVTGDTGTFVREDGVWKWDEESWRSGFNAYARTMAEEQGVTVPEFLISMLEEERGKTAPRTIWSPMKK